MTIGLALRMQHDLARLARRHGTPPARPIAVPLSAPTDRAVIVSGLAATTGVDLTRQRFRSWAFSNPCLLLNDQPKPPLYYKHDESKIVGEILTLKYDDAGNVIITARVDDATARRAGAFSIGAKIERFSLHNESSSDYFALIESASIMEVSLTDAPAQPAARVLQRHPASSAATEFYDIAARGMTVAGKIVETLRQLQAQRPPPRRKTPSPHHGTPSRRPTQFANLVAHMNELKEVQHGSATN